MPSFKYTNSQNSLDLRYLLAPTIFIAFTTAAPTEKHSGSNKYDMRVDYEGLRKWTLKEELAEMDQKLELRSTPEQPDIDSESDDDDVSDDEEDHDDHSDADHHEPTTTSPPTSTNTALADVIAESVQINAPKSAKEELQTHLAIGFGTVAAVIFLAAISYLLYRFRARLFPRFRRNSEINFPHMTETRAPKPPRSLFGGGTTNSSSRQTYNFMPAHPAPALAPSTVGLARAESRRALVRNSLLPAHTRFPIAARANDDSDARSFFLEAEERPTHSPAPSYTTQPLTAQVPADSHVSVVDGYTHFAAPPIPDSPEAAKKSSHFSWTTAAGGSEKGAGVGAGRESLVSEPPRFRTVNSWVSNQANQATGRVSRAPSVPPTPRAFKAHPGAEVQFVARHNRLESRDLDRMVMRESVGGRQ